MYGWMDRWVPMLQVDFHHHFVFIFFLCVKPVFIVYIQRYFFFVCVRYLCCLFYFISGIIDHLKTNFNIRYYVLKVVYSFPFQFLSSRFVWVNIASRNWENIECLVDGDYCKCLKYWWSVFFSSFLGS